MAGDPAPRGRARLLVLGAGAGQLGALRAARERGLYVVAVDRNPDAPGFAYADRRAIVSTEDEPGIERLARAESVDGLLAPGIDWPVGIAARVAEKLGLPHPIDAATGSLVTSKARQRERLAAAGVPQPRSQLVTSADEVEIDVPCVVKAPDRQGQRGLSLVDMPEGLSLAVSEAVTASRAGVALVEELVDGPEVTVNAFSLGGAFHPLTVADRLTAAPPAFGVALAHVWPSEADAAGAVEVARLAAEALGIADGPSYTQVRIGRDGARVVELAARLGGGHDAELCEAALGVALNDLAIDAALGLPVAPPRAARERPAAVVFLVPPEGLLDRVEGEEEAEAAEGVERVYVYRRPGHRFGAFRRGSDRAGAVLAVGRTREEALARGRRAADLIRFVTADDGALV